LVETYKQKRFVKKSSFLSRSVCYFCCSSIQSIGRLSHNNFIRQPFRKVRKGRLFRVAPPPQVIRGSEKQIVPPLLTCSHNSPLPPSIGRLSPENNEGNETYTPATIQSESTQNLPHVVVPVRYFLGEGWGSFVLLPLLYMMMGLSKTTIQDN
jgi:hypothetical protein